MTLKILVTNDDGINAPGLAVAESIAKEIVGEGGEVITVAPAVDQSGVGHSISYLRPSLISKHNNSRYSVEGSPADCVLAGIYYVMKNNKPDLILSGVNNGHNLAEDILYSGTVGAAMEGALQGVKSIALSQCYSKESLMFANVFESALLSGAKVCSKLIALKTLSSKAQSVFYNVNFPPIKNSEVKGVKICKQGKRLKGTFSMDSLISPNGRTFLMVNHKPRQEESKKFHKYKSDIEMIKKKFITVTPLESDLTEYEAFTNLEKQFANDH